MQPSAEFGFFIIGLIALIGAALGFGLYAIIAKGIRKKPLKLGWGLTAGFLGAFCFFGLSIFGVYKIIKSYGLGSEGNCHFTISDSTDHTGRVARVFSLGELGGVNDRCTEEAGVQNGVFKCSSSGFDLRLSSDEQRATFGPNSCSLMPPEGIIIQE